MKKAKVKQRFVMYGLHKGVMITSVNIPHFYVRDDKSEYLMCRQPAGDFTIHQINCRGKVGYCGEVITFVMDDGELVEVKGPVPCDDLFEHETADHIAKVLGRPEVARKAFRIEVGFDLVARDKDPVIIYEEPNFILGDWRYRVETAWTGMDLRVHARVGAMCMKIDEVLADDYERVFNTPKLNSPRKRLVENAVT